ncbi:hypothetical protein PISMIDRAFT_575487 [Pisolithus microcarpus 441]|uniref:Uncharacterized protein n=1 Tax=Pisolithus microcarpus 441 TaxID=765257 RepID=A0A0C9YV83_9AGAM|nr:hypothetical protein PISMIDRAFT_575487 [Pisolithus microcarpus 441]
MHLTRYLIAQTGQNNDELKASVKGLDWVSRCLVMDIEYAERMQPLSVAMDLKSTGDHHSSWGDRLSFIDFSTSVPFKINVLQCSWYRRVHCAGTRARDVLKPTLADSVLFFKKICRL